MDKQKAKSKHFPVKRPRLFKKDKENRGKKGNYGVGSLNVSKDPSICWYVVMHKMIAYDRYLP